MSTERDIQKLLADMADDRDALKGCCCIILLTAFAAALIISLYYGHGGSGP